MVFDTETGLTSKYDWFGDFINFVNKKHGNHYATKNVQRTILAQKRSGKNMKWKEFEFVYV